MLTKATLLETMDLESLTSVLKPLRKNQLNRAHLPALLRTVKDSR